MNDLAVCKSTSRSAPPPLVVPLLALLTVVLLPAVANGPWHPPDGHSSLPHHASGSTLVAESASRMAATPLVPGVELRTRVSPNSERRPGIVDSEPPEHPPR